MLGTQECLGAYQATCGEQRVCSFAFAEAHVWCALGVEHCASCVTSSAAPDPLLSLQHMVEESMIQFVPIGCSSFGPFGKICSGFGTLATGFSNFRTCWDPCAIFQDFEATGNLALYFSGFGPLRPIFQNFGPFGRQQNKDLDLSGSGLSGFD